VTSVAWHPREELLATGCGDNKVRVWDTAEGMISKPALPRCVLAGHQSAVFAVAFNHRGDLLVSSAFDSTVRLWDTLNWRLAVTKQGIGWCPRIPFNPDDNLFGYGYACYGYGCRRLGLCNVAPGRECRQLWLDPKLASHTGAFDFSHDGRYLLSAHNDGARVWDPGTGKQVSWLPETNVTCVSFARQGTFIFTSGDGGLREWRLDATAPGQFRNGPHSFFAGQPLSGEPFSMSSDGRTLALNADLDLLLFDTATRQARPRLGQSSGFYRCAVSPDGQWVAGAALPTTFVRVWDLDHTNVFRDLPCHWVSCLAVSPDSQWLITGSAYEYQVWDARSWQCTYVAPRSGQGYNACVAFAPNGQLMAVTDSVFTVRLLETATGRELATFGMPEPQFIHCLAFSPDGSQLAVGGQTPVIYLWDLQVIRQELAAMKLDWE
jgi:WD40 repeat protein